MRLTENDRRVLDDMCRVCEEYDGYIPHGSASWAATRRLVACGLAEYAGDGVCCECDYVAHRDEETVLASYRPTELGLASTGESQ